MKDTIIALVAVGDKSVQSVIGYYVKLKKMGFEVKILTDQPYHFNEKDVRLYTKKIFNYFDCYLYYTGYTRSSTEVLKNVIVPKQDTFNPLVKQAEKYLLNEQYYLFMDMMKEGWEEKKRTSKNVLQNVKILEIDTMLSNMKECVAHKLCGAGNGGFFLCFFEKGTQVSNEFYKINLTADGVTRII